MKTLDELQKNLTKKQVRVLGLLTDDLEKNYEIVKDEYDVKTDEIAQMILDSLDEQVDIQEYSWTKKKLEQIEETLFNIALGSEKDTDRIKAGTYIHDKVKGKAKQNVDVTSGGEKIQANVIQFVDTE